MDYIKCPKCGNTDVINCPGGTCYRPSKWVEENIKYLCTNEDCLNEFGDADIIEARKASYSENNGCFEHGRCILCTVIPCPYERANHLGCTNSFAKDESIN